MGPQGSDMASVVVRIVVVVIMPVVLEVDSVIEVEVETGRLRGAAVGPSSIHSSTQIGTSTS